MAVKRGVAHEEGDQFPVAGMAWDDVAVRISIRKGCVGMDKGHEETHHYRNRCVATEFTTLDMICISADALKH